MSDIDTIIPLLQGFVRGSCQQSIATGQQQVILKEAGAAARGRLDKVTIQGFKGSLAVFHPDKSSPKLCPFLDEGITQKACDAIVFTAHKGKNYVIICELKSGTHKGVVSQFKNSAAIADFLQSLCLHHEGLNLSDWERRYVLIGARPLKKKKTRNDKLISGTTPERPREISVRNECTLFLGALCQPEVE